MTQRDQLIQDIYTSDKIRTLALQLCRRFVSNSYDVDDVMSHLCERLLKMPPQEIVRLHNDGKLDAYVYASIRNIGNDVAKAKTALGFSPNELNFGDTIGELNISNDDDEQQPDLDYHEIVKFCYEIGNTDEYDERVKTAANVTLAYLTYQPEKKRTYRDFQKRSGIHFSSVCVYVKMIAKLYKTKTTTYHE